MLELNDNKVKEDVIMVQCPLCPKKYRGLNGLKIHTATHKKENELTKKNLEKTLDTRTGESPVPVEMNVVVAQPSSPVVIHKEMDRLEKLEKKLENLADLLSAVVDKKNDHITTTVNTTQTITSKVEDIIPSSWRQIVNEVLGNDINLKVHDSSGGNFILFFFLPDYLDRRVGERIGKDHSTGLIRRASPEADVRKWAELVAANIKKTYPSFKPKTV